MTLYARFLTMLALGLSGLTVVLIVLMDRLFTEWDMFAAIAAWFDELAEGKYLIRPQRAQDAEIEAERESSDSGRYLKRQKELKEIEAVETRLKGPNGPIVLTPLPRFVAPPAPVRPKIP